MATMTDKEAFDKVQLEGLQKDLVEDRNKPDSYWNNRNLLAAHSWACIDFCNRGYKNQYERKRHELLQQEILDRMNFCK
jgi:hypothetical protein